MANSTTIITDLKSAQTAGAQPATLANAINPSGLSATGGAGNMTGTSGVYAAGTFYGGVMDYPGMISLAITKAQELAVLLTKILVNTDQATDGTNQALLAKILNDFQ